MLTELSSRCRVPRASAGSADYLRRGLSSRRTLERIVDVAFVEEVFGSEAPRQTKLCHGNDFF